MSISAALLIRHPNFEETHAWAVPDRCHVDEVLDSLDDIDEQAAAIGPP
jgi:hypothetical protein